MIDAGPSLESAAGLSGTALLTYLLAQGWTARPSRVDGISIVSKEVPGASAAAEFILPVKPGFEDEHRRVADALRTIAAIEKCSEASVAAAARRAFILDGFEQLLLMLGNRRDVMDVKLFLKEKNDEGSRDMLRALERMELD